MSSPFVKLVVTNVIVLCGAWSLYCMTPAGASEREQTRQQKEMARQLAQEPTKNTQKRSTA